MSECCICFEIKELKSTEVCSHSFCDKCLLELDECALCRAVIAKPKKPFEYNVNSAIESITLKVNGNVIPVDDRLMDPLPQKRWKLPRKMRKIDWKKFK